MVRLSWLPASFQLTRYPSSPICSRDVSDQVINEHIDSGCEDHLDLSSSQTSSSSSVLFQTVAKGSQKKSNGPSSSPMAPIFSQGHKKAPELSSSPLTKIHAKKRAVAEDTTTLPSFKRNKLVHLEAAAPLAEKSRPSALCDFVGQSHLTSPDSVLLKMIGSVSGSAIFWGPPG